MRVAKSAVGYYIAMPIGSGMQLTSRVWLAFMLNLVLGRDSGGFPSIRRIEQPLHVWIDVSCRIEAGERSCIRHNPAAAGVS